MANNIVRSGYSPGDTKAAKGVAVLLMLVHHLYAFPERLPGGALRNAFSAFGVPLPTILGDFGKICVSIFFFLGGYGLWLSSQRDGFDLLGKVKKLYFTYWEYVTVFIAIGFAFFAHQGVYNSMPILCETFDRFTWGELIQNLLGISSSYNGTWWFFESYVIALLLFPTISPLFNKRSFASGFARVAIASILITNIVPAVGQLEVLGKLRENPIYSLFIQQTAVPWVACFWLGSVFAEHDGLVHLRERLFSSKHSEGMKAVYAFGGLAVVVYLRQFWVDEDFDIFYVPIFLVCLKVLFDYVPFAQKAFLELGKISTGVWLIHGFLIYRFGLTAQLIVASRWCVPALVVLLASSIASVLVVDWLWKEIRHLISMLNNQ